MPDPGSSSSVCGKRRRTLSIEHNDGQESEPQPAVSRSDLWFDDGSVVIQAEDTQFRVHRSMLSRHSQIFRDMFSIPQPVDSKDTIEGCPVVHLTDSAQDVTHLLSALYDQMSTSRQALSFAVVAAMLRLGTKYDFRLLREEAVVRLCAEFPATLEFWDRASSEYTHILDQKGILFDIVNLALEQQLLSILPAAYFACTRSDLEDILKGRLREDGSKCILLPEAQHACILGRQEILEQQADTTLSWLDDASSCYCINPRRCADERSDIAISFFRPVADTYRSLEQWDEVPKGLICENCAEEAKLIHNKGRRTMWDKMPENFGLPPWDELKKISR